MLLPSNTTELKLQFHFLSYKIAIQNFFSPQRKDSYTNWSSTETKLKKGEIQKLD